MSLSMQSATTMQNFAQHPLYGGEVGFEKNTRVGR